MEMKLAFSKAAPLKRAGNKCLGQGRVVGRDKAFFSQAEKNSVL